MSHLPAPKVAPSTDVIRTKVNQRSQTISEKRYGLG